MKERNYQTIEFISKSAAPSNGMSLIAIGFKIIIIIFLLSILLKDDSASTLGFKCEFKDGLNEGGECGNPGLHSHLPTLFGASVNLESVGGTVMHFLEEVLPRLVASSLMFYIGICCSYVGLVHLKVIKPD